MRGLCTRTREVAPTCGSFTGAGCTTTASRCSLPSANARTSTSNGANRPSCSASSRAVDEDGAGEVDAFEAKQRAIGDEAAPVDPRALGHPFGEPAVALVVRARHLAGAHEIVEHAARHAGRQPARRVPRLARTDMPAPFVAQAAAQLPAVAVERHHCSRRFASRVGFARSRGTRTVAISLAPTSRAISRSKRRIDTVASCPAVS